MKKTTKTKILVGVVLIAVIIFYIINFQIMLSKNNLAKNDFDKKDYLGTIQEFNLNSPEINDLTYEGEQYAPLTIIFVADFNSDESSTFYKDILPQLKTKYIDSGQAKLYHKYVISREELASKTGVFPKVQASRCFANLTKNSTINFQIILAQAIGNDFTSLAESNGANPQDFKECVENVNFKSNYLDMLETERFIITGPSIYLGVNGGDYTLMHGNPSINDIYKKMRLKEIKVGLN